MCALSLSFAPLDALVPSPRLTDGATIPRKRALTVHACFCCAHLLPDSARAGSADAAGALWDLVTAEANSHLSDELSLLARGACQMTSPCLPVGPPCQKTSLCLPVGPPLLRSLNLILNSIKFELRISL